eukprot:410622-Pleurochrysis_carterae.AAC.6
MHDLRRLLHQAQRLPLVGEKIFRVEPKRLSSFEIFKQRKCHFAEGANSARLDEASHVTRVDDLGHGIRQHESRAGFLARLLLFQDCALVLRGGGFSIHPCPEVTASCRVLSRSGTAEALLACCRPARQARRQASARAAGSYLSLVQYSTTVQ